MFLSIYWNFVFDWKKFLQYVYFYENYEQLNWIDYILYIKCCLRTFSDCSYAQSNEHISYAHHYQNFYENLFHFYII